MQDIRVQELGQSESVLSSTNALCESFCSRWPAICIKSSCFSIIALGEGLGEIRAPRRVQSLIKTILISGSTALNMASVS